MVGDGIGRLLRLRASRVGGVLVGVLVLALNTCGAPAGPPTPGPSSAAAPPPPSVLPSRSVPLPEPAPAPSPTPGFAPRGFTVVGSGDVLLHNGLWAQAQRDNGGSGYDFRPILAGVQPVVSAADLAICHLETPLGSPGGPFTGYPVFKVPPQIVPALRDTGYDACSTASNHSIDGGEAGVRRTLDALDRAGIAHAGMARSRAEQDTPTIVTVRGVRVGLLSYSFSFNGLRRPKGKEWLVNLLEPDRVRAAARRARQAGAEVVIASIHWGTEYEHDPNSQQRDVAKRLLSDGSIDLILGHHAHVVQPFERIGERWVAYGMGNHISYQGFSEDTRDGVLSRFTFAEVGAGRFRVVKAEALPTYMRLNDGAARLLLVSACPARSARACRASGDRSTRVLRSRGADPALLTILR
ncbi:CapA family protein [Catellatospora sp. KI3]|uniref:CapA family protein n=1 Tax=Catellatospora sp. KI3 TaxID=3041620 RepID=UPI002482568E|nr:CapA family protein [Catellatospora sp. KI3]MDI1464180.1 CapA family protein [Catellatospora sp. KI3]